MSTSTATALEAEDLKINKDKLSVKYAEEEDGEFTDDAGLRIGEQLDHSLHPLETTWKLWIDNGAAKTKATMLPIHSFSTVEDFWSLYNNINSPSKFPVNSDVYCFKEKIEPKWEDPLCANGGKWTVVFPKGKSDAAWLYTLLALIGDQFDHGEEICGAVVNVRGRQEKVSIWTKNASNEIVQTTIGSQWKKMIDYHDAVGFIAHEDAKRDRNTRNKYTV